MILLLACACTVLVSCAPDRHHTVSSPICAPRCDAKSACSPVRIFTTPAGTSDASRMCEKSVAAKGKGALAQRVIELPVLRAAAMGVTKPRRGC